MSKPSNDSPTVALSTNSGLIGVSSSISIVVVSSNLWDSTLVHVQRSLLRHAQPQLGYPNFGCVESPQPDEVNSANHNRGSFEYHRFVLQQPGALLGWTLLVKIQLCIVVLNILSSKVKRRSRRDPVAMYMVFFHLYIYKARQMYCTQLQVYKGRSDFCLLWPLFDIAMMLSLYIHVSLFNGLQHTNTATLCDKKTTIY